MTLESVEGENCRLFTQSESVDLYEIGEVPCLYTPIELPIQASKVPKKRLEKPRRPTRQHLFDRLLKRLSGMEFVGRDYAEAYLRDQYRRGCRDNTMRSSLKGIELFLTSITDAGKGKKGGTLFTSKLAREVARAKEAGKGAFLASRLVWLVGL
jgi:hypothetical protein